MKTTALLLAAVSTIACATSPTSTSPTPTPTTSTKRVLIVTTSHAVKGSTGAPTGAYITEVTHPYDVFIAAGWQVDFASIKGGIVPLDGVADNAADTSATGFLNDAAVMHRFNSGVDVDAVDAAAYDAIFLAGGHGAMWDFIDDDGLARAVGSVFDGGGVVGAVCHGPAGLINAKQADGRFVVDGKNVAAFSNDEERAVGLVGVVPVLLQDALAAHGAKLTSAPNWQPHVVVDGRLVTGQNPASAKGVAEAIVAAAR